MTVRPVILAPDPVLSMVCAEVAAFDGDLADLAWDMLQTMYDAKGRGLAAPQIGVLQRVFVMDSGWKQGTPRPQVFVNPRIVAACAHQTTYEEGCLSIPNRPVRLARPAWVDLAWQSLSGAPHQARFDGFEAVCVQHERDHLDGILITDRAA